MTIRTALLATAFIAVCFACLATRSQLLISLLLYATGATLSVAAAVAACTPAPRRNSIAAFALSGLVFFVFDCQNSYSLSSYLADAYTERFLDNSNRISYTPNVESKYANANATTYTVDVPEVPKRELHVFRSFLTMLTAFVSGILVRSRRAPRKDGG